MQLRQKLLDLAHACGELHPGLVTSEHLEILDTGFAARSATDVFDYEPSWGLPGNADQATIPHLMAP